MFTHSPRRHYCLRFDIRMSMLIALFLLIGMTQAHTQEASKEFWPELDVWWKFSPQWRASLYVPFSKNIETNYREGSIVAQGDYQWRNNKRILFMRAMDEDRAAAINTRMIRAGYLVGKSLGDQGEAYSENTAYAEFHIRLPLKGQWLLSHRFRTDLRWLGEDNDFSQRIRYRLMLEREFWTKGISFVPYVNVEPYYDSRYNTINRTRYIAGTSVSWTPICAIEANMTYQHDTRSSVTNLFAVNLILHVFIVSHAIDGTK